MKIQIVVVIGAGGIGMAIARRQGFSKHILLEDFDETLLANAVKELEVPGHKVSSLRVDISSRESLCALADKAARVPSIRKGSP
jgi:NAD(P)-dependent dehydrogenase (short-subunit alcohol dehydrogenase family)